MAKKRKKNASRNADPKALAKKVVAFFEEHPNQPYNPRQLAGELGLKTQAERDALQEVLEVLAGEGTLEEVEKMRFSMPQREVVVEGKVDMTKSGSAYVITEAFENDVYVPHNKVNGALDGDVVKVSVANPRRKLHGEVVEVVERNKTVFAGIVEVSEKFAFLVPDGKKMHTDIFIPLNALNGAKSGDKALAEMIEWPRKAKSPVGRITSVLGRPGDHQTEMNAIIAEFDLPTAFPEEVEAEAEAIEDVIPEQELARREDFRGVPTFTIDPEDAKDFDDALSIRSTKGGYWEVGIHIADVTHYVRPGTALDREAYERATSIYLVDRVIPMLPERLSNQICSLRPDEDKLVFSAVFEINGKGKIRSERFGRSVIRSQQRFTYEQAQEVLDGKRHKLGKLLRKLNQLAYKLRELKFANGAISFETTEVKFELDENGKPLGVTPKVRADAHKLIEDFMLLANRRVASYISRMARQQHGRPFVYRVHASPDSEKLDNFTKLAARFGYHIDRENPSQLSHSFNKLLRDVEGKPEEAMLQTMAIRTMSKAHYTTDNIGHYGLAFEDYTHFTSPIRRYPDMIAHRLLDDYLQSRRPPERDALEKTLRHCSQKEVNAEEAERASIKYKQVEYMQQFLGEEMEGIISGVTEWGLFVEALETKCEGMVRLSEMLDDYYFLDDEKFQVIGYNSRRKYRIGDRVKVRIIDTNLQRRTIDMDMLGKISDGPAPNARPEAVQSSGSA